MTTKLSPEAKAEYDALGLPLNYNVEHSYVLNSAGRIITQGCTDCTSLRTIVKYANSHHALIAERDALRHSIDEIRAVACGEHGIFDDAEEAMKLILAMTIEALKKREQP